MNLLPERCWIKSKRVGIKMSKGVGGLLDLGKTINFHAFEFKNIKMIK